IMAKKRQVIGGAKQGPSGKVRQMKLPPGATLLHTLEGDAAHIHKLAWSPDGTRIASPADDGSLRVWDAISGKSTQTLARGSKEKLVAAAWSKDGSKLVSDPEHRLRVWDARSWAVRSDQEATHLSSTSIDWAPNDRFFAQAMANNAIRVVSADLA